MEAKTGPVDLDYVDSQLAEAQPLIDSRDQNDLERGYGIVQEQIGNLGQIMKKPDVPEEIKLEAEKLLLLARRMEQTYNAPGIIAP